MRLSTLLVVGSAGLLLLSACSAILGIDDVPAGPPDGGAALDATAPPDASHDGDAGAGDAGSDSTTPITDAGDAATGAGQDGEASLPPFPYTSVSTITPGDAGELPVTGVVVSPNGQCVAVQYGNAFDLYSIDGDGGSTFQGDTAFNTPAQLIIDRSAAMLYVATGLSTAATVSPFSLAGCKPGMTNFNFKYLTDETQFGTALGLAGGSPGLLLVGGVVSTPKMTTTVFAYDGTNQTYLGRMDMAPASATNLTTALSADLAGSVVAAIASGQLFFGNRNFFATSVPLQGTPISLDGGTPKAMAVDPGGTSLFVATGDELDQTLLELDQSSSWAQKGSASIPSDDDTSPLLAVSTAGLTVSIGDTGHTVVSFALDAGTIVGRSQPKTFDAAVVGLSASANGRVLAVATASGVEIFTMP